MKITSFTLSNGVEVHAGATNTRIEYEPLDLQFLISPHARPKGWLIKKSQNGSETIIANYKAECEAYTTAVMLACEAVYSAKQSDKSIERITK